MTRRGAYQLVVAACLLLAAFPALAQDEAGDGPAWAEYVNERFDYVCTYPVSFTPQREADNGDGRRFLAQDMDAEISCWGANLLATSLADTAARIEEILVSRGASVTYKRVEADWFVISGLEADGRIYYRRTILRNGVLASFLLLYAESDREFFDPVVTAMAQGLRFTR